MNLPQYQARLAEVPEEPGVYLFHDAGGKVIYVGKAASLRQRLRSYLPVPSSAPKEGTIGSLAATLETIVTRSELEALMLEQTLIQKHHPRWNVSWRDNKTYPFLEVTMADDFPRVYFTRKTARKGARRFGPYTAGSAHRLQRIVNQYLRMPSCRVELDGKQTPCLYHHLGWCDAPCAGLITKEGYRRIVDQVRLFLDGRGPEVLVYLKGEMQSASEAEDFELAAKLRDRIRAVGELLEDQAVVHPVERDAEVLGLARSGAYACLALLTIHEGKLVNKHEFLLRRAGEHPDGELLRAFLEQHYADNPVPPQVLVPALPEGDGVLAQWLAVRRGGPVELAAPSRGRGRELLELAAANARAALVTRGRVGEEEARAQLAAAAGALSLAGEPRHLEAVDLSRQGGAEAVGAVVVFRLGLPASREYRKFLVKVAPGDDDFAGMREVVGRRLKRLREEGAGLPDLFLIDGGLGHLHAAQAGARDAGAETVPLVAIAKREELLFLPDRAEPVRLPDDSPALHLLVRARDEAHRYVNAYQRTRRSMELREGARGLKRAAAKAAAR